MSTKLTKPVTRRIRLRDMNGREADVDVTVAESGLLFGKGRRKLPILAWADIVKHLVLPENAPARFGGNAIGWPIELGQPSEDSE